MASHFFTSRFGGVSASPYHENNLATHVGDELSAVAENRRRLVSMIGNVSFMNQSHGDTVVLVEDLPRHEPSADAMITQTRGIYLAVLTADCIPLLLWDDNSLCVAAVHVGRKGILNDISLKTIDIMRALGSGHIRGVMGPSICGKCYEVGEDVYQEVVSKFPNAASVTNKGTRSLDLAGALKELLISYGVEVVRAQSCTVEDRSLFSYRRDVTTGRFAGIISL